MIRKLNWQAFTNNDRNKVIDELKDIISDYDGFILNFNMFSDLTMSLSIEIEENKIVKLYQALSQILNVSDFETNSIRIESRKNWVIFMNISFSIGKGDLSVENRLFPGS